MAKAAAGHPSPVPLQAQILSWGLGLTMHRVHDGAYLSDVFNPSVTGNARFSPICDPKGKVIPTLYAATTVRGALMETIFHDVPYKKGLKSVSKTRLVNKVHSAVQFKTDFQLIDLSKVALRKMGIKPEHIIATTKAHYPETRRWAQALYEEYPTAQGLLWTSRQDDRSQAVVLFGDRIKPSDLSAAATSQELISSGKVWDVVDTLATDMGVILS